VPTKNFGQAEEEQIEVGRKKATMSARFSLATYYVREDERLEELSL
jgi:hypothetical protein